MTNRVEVIVQWKYGSTTWEILKDMKNSYPLQMDKYAVHHHIAGEPAFAWWIHNVLANRNHIIVKLNSKYWVRTHKFGVNISKLVQEAKSFYEENENSLWWDSIHKETNKIIPDFEVWEKEISEFPPGYQNITCHTIFDVKTGKKFRIKERFVADGHNHKTPTAMAYSSVVSRGSVGISLTISAINDLDMLA